MPPCRRSRVPSQPKRCTAISPSLSPKCSASTPPGFPRVATVCRDDLDARHRPGLRGRHQELLGKRSSNLGGTAGRICRGLTSPATPTCDKNTRIVVAAETSLVLARTPGPSKHNLCNGRYDFVTTGVGNGPPACPQVLHALIPRLYPLRRLGAAVTTVSDFPHHTSCQRAS